MARRLRSWARTLAKLVLLVLGYFWLGAAYKLVYAQTHDITRFKGRIPIPYYQQQFLLDALLYQTWLFGPDFRTYIGELPSLGTLVSTNTQAALADYCRARERELSSLPDRYPFSLFAEEALEDGFLYSQGASFLGLIGSREEPKWLFATLGDKGWLAAGIPDDQRATELSRRLADEYPTSPQAPLALERVARAEAQAGRRAGSLAIYRRLLAEYPRSPQAEEAAEALYRAARDAGRLQQARRYKRRALEAAERAAREQYAGQALPARTTLSIMGFRLDLSGLELQLQRVDPARELAAVAEREAARVQAYRGLEPQQKDDLRERREQLEEVRNQLWVADLFDTLKVELPGPAPRAREFPVSGEVRLQGKPVEGVEIILSERRHGRPGPRALPRTLEGTTYRGRTDRRGRFRITGVPAGIYLPMAVLPARGENAAPIVPQGMDPHGAPNYPQRVVVRDAPVKLPPLQLATALSTRTFGEVPPAGNAVRLEWNAWPGAAGYVVRVRPVRFMRGAFLRRVPREKRDAFRDDPVLWSAEKVKETSADCPLSTLAPDIPPQALVMQYEYEVQALDRTGKVLAGNSRPLSRFFLSAQARELMLQSAPPLRGGSTPRRRQRPRREER